MALLTAYRWERKHYERTSRESRWHDTGSDELMFITPSWYEEKTGSGEVAWFRALGAYVRVSHDPYGSRYGAVTYFKNISPDGLAKTEEVFTPVSLWEAYQQGGWREREALDEAYDQRRFDVVMNTDEHLCVRFGIETTAIYDFVGNRWIG